MLSLWSFLWKVNQNNVIVLAFIIIWIMLNFYNVIRYLLPTISIHVNFLEMRCYCLMLYFLHWHLLVFHFMLSYLFCCARYCHFIKFAQTFMDLDLIYKMGHGWYRNRNLVWDCTCVDTFAGVHLNRSAMEAGTAANSAEKRNCRKYTALAEAHQFEPITVETMGVYGESTGVILRAIGGHQLLKRQGSPGGYQVLAKPGYSNTARQWVHYSFSRKGSITGLGSRGWHKTSLCSWGNFLFH